MQLGRMRGLVGCGASGRRVAAIVSKRSEGRSVGVVCASLCTGVSGAKRLVEKSQARRALGGNATAKATVVGSRSFTQNDQGRFASRVGLPESSGYRVLLLAPQ